MNRNARPVAISCGEPAGIGPEVAVAAWAALRETVPMLWIGDPRHLPTDTPVALISDASEARAASPLAFPVLAMPFSGDVRHGQADPKNAQGVIDAIKQGVALTKSGATSAICTSPIHKKALKDGAGFAFPGHTEFLAHLAGPGVQAVMMLASEQLRVVPTTIHIPLEEVATTLTPTLLRQTIEITRNGLRDQFGIADPRLAVAGLNPHAGEGGAMGRQEQDWIAALITQIRSEGCDVTGPLPADTMFHPAARARYDAAICMYHDQALIPIKTLDFDRGVNVTLGLPFIRTSPDHGTAFDIAGQGRANPTSMIEAVRMAWTMSQARA
jgi:4-hydroxythreonine-4-phosphate dehydrogenase